VRMSLSSRREYLKAMVQRYQTNTSRIEKSQIIDELIEVLGYHRKYAIQILNGPIPVGKPRQKRHKSCQYTEALPVIQTVWEALDCPCAERLQPVMLSTAELLANHGELVLSPLVRSQLTLMSRATLARRLTLWRSPKAKRILSQRKALSRLRSEIPIDRYGWKEDRPGALEIDLVEHNGGSSLGHYAYTLSIVDIVSGYSRRRAVLGRGQAAVFRAIQRLLVEWPFRPWGLHSDNGSEFINNQLLRFCQMHSYTFTRSRPYHKNDNAHVEQKNLQYVREIVGYERYDTPNAVDWLNDVYSVLDPYANLILPMRKVVNKQRQGAHVHKSYDIAKTPFRRLKDADALNPNVLLQFEHQYKTLNPLNLHQQLEKLLMQGPFPKSTTEAQGEATILATAK
jgi:transposase InsO family protein